MTYTIKFAKVENWYGNLARYEARDEHPSHRGTYVIEADPSDVYESRLNGYTIKWVSDTDPTPEQIGSRNLRFGRGERLLAEAKTAVRIDAALAILRAAGIVEVVK